MDCYDSVFCCGDCDECDYLNDFCGEPTIEEKADMFIDCLIEILPGKPAAGRRSI